MFDLGMIHGSPFYQMALLLVLSAGVGYLGLLLRQPMIVAFIAVGLLAGPSGFGIIQSTENIELLAQLGITVLLFLVGLKLDLKLIRTLGTISLLAGLGQIGMTWLFGFMIALFLGFAQDTSFFIALALTFSSTIIIVKLLSDKREIDSLHGRISIGILIVQDVVVVIGMMLLSAFSGQNESKDFAVDAQDLLLVVAQGLILLLLIIGFVVYAANAVIKQISHSPELLIIFSMSWAALFAAAGHYYGFGKELGGLLAGISLASTPYRDIIVGRLSSLRDFLLLFFFVFLGAQLDIQFSQKEVLAAILLALFVLVFKPLIVMSILGLMGYKKRTSFLSGMALGQISEFSLIFIAMVHAYGFASSEALGLVTLIGLITFALSSYFITYSFPLYQILEKWLGPFERKSPQREAELGEANSYNKVKHDIILFGLGRYGKNIANQLQTSGHRILGVDFNPELIKQWKTQGYDVIYGDACDFNFIADLPLSEATWVISAMPYHDIGLLHNDPRIMLIDALRSQGYKGNIAVSAYHEHEVSPLKEKGATVVFLPFQEAAERAVERVNTFGSA